MILFGFARQTFERVNSTQSHFERFMSQKRHRTGITRGLARLRRKVSGAFRCGLRCGALLQHAAQGAEVEEQPDAAPREHARQKRACQNQTPLRFERDFAKSQAVSLEAWKARPLWRRVKQRVWGWIDRLVVNLLDRRG